MEHKHRVMDGGLREGQVFMNRRTRMFFVLVDYFDDGKWGGIILPRPGFLAPLAWDELTPEQIRRMAPCFPVKMAPRRGRKVRLEVPGRGVARSGRREKCAMAFLFPQKRGNGRRWVAKMLFDD